MGKKNWKSYLRELEKEKTETKKLESNIEKMVLEDPRCRDMYELIKKKSQLDSIISTKTENLELTRVQMCDHIIIDVDAKDECYMCIIPDCQLRTPYSGRVISEIDLEYYKLKENGELMRHLFGIISFSYATKLYREAIQSIGEDKSSYEIMAKMYELASPNAQYKLMKRESHK